MRLSKRLAVGVLAAVMALSMLTACGGTGGNGTGGNPSSKPGQTPPSSGSSSSSSSSTGSGSTGDKADIPTTGKGDRAIKYFERLEKRTQYDHETVTDQFENGVQTHHTTCHVVTDGNRWMMKLSGGLGDNYFNEIYIADVKEKTSYYFTEEADSTIHRSKESAIDLNKMKETSVMSDDARELKDYKMTVGTYNVDGTLYYSETYGIMSIRGIAKVIYCFDMSDLEGNYLRYVVRQSPTILTKTKYITDTTKIYYSDLQVPEGHYLDDRDVPSPSIGIKTPKDNYPN